MEISLSNVNYLDKLVDINCKFESGKITSIIGKSGSGKSLLGFIIMKLVKSEKGHVLVDGMSLYDNHKFMKDVGYVFQNPFDHFFCDNVFDEVSFGLKQFKFKLGKINKQVSGALKMVGLDDSYMYKKINSLSSGEAERIAIASSLVLNPKVLILDEPTIYLDFKVKKSLIELVKLLKDKYNKTVIVISNDMDFVYSVSDNYLLMDSGKIVKYGNVKDIMSDDVDLCSYGMEIPLIKQFINMVKEKKGIDLGNVTDIDELVEEVINNV